MRKLSSLGIVVALSTLATTALGTNAWTGWGTISVLQDYGNGPAVRTSAPIVNPANCNPSNMYFPLPALSDAARASIGRSILSAYMAGKSIRLKIVDNACADSYPAYYAVDVGL